MHTQFNPHTLPVTPFTGSDELVNVKAKDY